MRRFEAPKPVEEGDIIEIKVESQNGKGEGIGRIDDFVVFIEKGKIGEYCKVRITEVKRTYASGEKISTLKNSNE